MAESAPTSTSTDEIARFLDLDPCCVAAFGRAADAWQAGTVDPAVGADLGHGGAGPALLELLHRNAADPAAVAAWADGLMAAAGPSVGALLVAAWAAEAGGDPLAALDVLTRAHGLDPGHQAVAGDLARYLTEQGRVDAAVRTMRDAGLDDDPLLGLLETLRLELRAAHRDLSRNDPCPCGSGRKYKHCHQRAGLEPSPRHRLLLQSVKLHLWLSGPEHRDRVPRLAAIAAEATPERLDAYLEDPQLADFAVWEGGVAASYRDARSALLSAADRDLLAATLATPRRLYEVTGHDRTVATIGLRPLPDGRPVTVEDDDEWDLDVGSLVAVRVVDVDGSSVRAGLAVEVDPGEAPVLVDLLAASADDEALARWYGRSPELTEP